MPWHNLCLYPIIIIIIDAYPHNLRCVPHDLCCDPTQLSVRTAKFMLLGDRCTKYSILTEII